MLRTTRRLFVIAGFAVLAGCVQSTTSDSASPGALNIQGVDVTIARQGGQLEDRGVNVSRAQVIADLENAIGRELAKSSRSNGVPATVAVTISEIELASMAERAIAGRSFAQGAVSVRGADGATIKGPTQVRGYAQALPAFGALGVVTTKTVMDDYRSTVSGFAKAVNTFVAGN